MKRKKMNCKKGCLFYQKIFFVNLSASLREIDSLKIFLGSRINFKLISKKNFISKIIYSKSGVLHQNNISFLSNKVLNKRFFPMFETVLGANLI